MLFLLFIMKFFKLFIILKLTLGFYSFMLLRATLPRYRIDFLILLNWKYFIPVFSVLYLICFFILS